MHQHEPSVITAPVAQSTHTNRVLRNTYLLLSMTLLFSAATASLAMLLSLPHPGLVITLVGYFGLLFLTQKFRNSAWSLFFVFALTGFMGLTLGPVISAYLRYFPNGHQLVTMAFAGTGAIFLGLSSYVVITRKDFSFAGSFLFTGILVAFLAGVSAWLFQMPMLALAVSAMFVLLMAGLILFKTSEIVNGGETNYVMATVTLYISIYNLFTSLLHLLGVFGDE